MIDRLSTRPYPPRSARYLADLDRRILVFDGAMGTSLQGRRLSPDDFGGPAFDGCHDHLVLTRPDVIGEIHRSFLAVGCDVITTCTFQATRRRLAEWGLGDKAHAINVAAAALARAAAADYEGDSQTRFVAGSLGPTGMLPSAADPVLSNVTFDELSDEYAAQARALVEGGADLLLLETAQDILEVKAALAGFDRLFDDLGLRLPVHVLITLDTSGRMLLGTDIDSALTTIDAIGVEGIGLNCSTGPEQMRAPAHQLSERTRTPIAVIPNAGLPLNVGDGDAVYPLEPLPMARALADLVRDHGVRIVGGCCGTTPAHMAAVADAVRELTPVVRESPGQIGWRSSRVSSAMRATDLRQQPPPLLVGERLNAQGSRRVKRHLLAGEYEALIEVAHEQADAGAHVLDVCVALTERSDEADQMAALVKLLSSRIDLPLMVDSTEPAVIASALEHLPGRGIVNSVNLENGRARLDAVLPHVRRHGAALVALCIDERGMALTRQHKVDVARRIHDIVVGEYGMPADALVFDVLAFTLATGDPAWADSASEAFEGIRLVKEALPGVLTALGISNVSFGLGGRARTVLNSVFLHHAVAAGLDVAILNPADVTPYADIPAAERDLADDLLFNRRTDALQNLVASVQGLTGDEADGAPGSARAVGTPAQQVHSMVVHRRKDGIEAALDAAGVRDDPVGVLNDVLLPAMQEVGDRFGAGETILPFVLQSAEVMRAAVAHVERFLKRGSGATKGIIVLATVFGDVHDIGKSLVHTILSNNGYTVHDLGKQVPVNTIVERAIALRADAIGLSALLVSTSTQMLLCVQELDRQGAVIPVLLGGAAINRRFGRRALFVEADRPYAGGVFYCKDAFEGLRIAASITNPERRATAVRDIIADARADRFLAAVPNPRPVTAVVPSSVRTDLSLPAPPFLGPRVVDAIPLDEVLTLVDRRELYRVQWGGRGSGDAFQRVVASEFEPALARLAAEAGERGWLRPRAVYGYFSAQSNGNTVILYHPGATNGDRSPPDPVARLTFPRQHGQEHLCLADYVRPASSGAYDVVALQVVTVGAEADARYQALHANGDYTEALYVHGLAVAAAEATAEWMHRRIRRELGLPEGQGKRYSWGYPACPDLAQHQDVFDLLAARSALDLELTTAYQIVPESSTAAFVVHHPEAKYFTVRRVIEA